MNTNALLHPRIRESELLQEFFNALTDSIPNIESYIAELKRTPNDKKVIADLFRALHNIKGDAALCKIDMGVLIAHPIETLLGRVRNGDLTFTDLLAEVMLLTVDRLELATEALVNGQKFLKHLNLVQLVNGLEDLAISSSGMINEKSILLIEAVTGFRPVGTQQIKKSLSPPVASYSASMKTDLDFFRSLALQYETRSPIFMGRSDRQVKLALSTNEVAGNLVDPLQLTAAVYMHDLGMLLLPESLWLKAGRLSDEERFLLRPHPGFGGGLLQRMAVWQTASEIVFQHHEMPDGSGYPLGLKVDQISHGAKILAIIDTFEAVSNKHCNHGANRSLVRAIAEINACDKQFAPEWIASFNTVVRRMV